MKRYRRFLDLRNEAETRSIFLFGPRQTGKTSLLRESFPDSPYYNLLKADVFFRLAARPQRIREELAARSSNDYPIVIDEIQKLPILLDEVHAIIEEYGKRFILTGSSARKLVRGGANLLGGRARTRRLYPLTSEELVDPDLRRIVTFGTLPSIYTSDDPHQDLLSYCGTYLQEEILAEGAVRRIEHFSRFLETAAFMNAELVNYEAVASDSGVPARTVREYFTILEDTLIGFTLPPFRAPGGRKPVSTSKFYFFDIGVANTLSGRTGIVPGSEPFGKSFEHFIATELRAYLSYTRDDRTLSFWRTHTGHEVDFLIGDEAAIEVKGTESVTGKHLKGLKAISEERTFRTLCVVSMDPKPRKLGDILVLPWREFLRRLWSGEFGPGV